MMITNSIQEKLFSLQDKKYGDFNRLLIPGTPKDFIIGVRIPEIRKLAKSLSKEEKTDFILDLPHSFHEENILHAIILNGFSDYCRTLFEVDRFLPYVNNWAVCDTIAPKAFSNNSERVLPEIFCWIDSASTYTVRFGIIMLMRLFLDERFKPEYLYCVARIRSDEYYVNMSRAWFLATALAKQYNDTLIILKNRVCDRWTHNKAIQKARESYRISPQQKNYLNTLKI